ncbi:purine-binding chemotaxis protein CheW [Geobacter argillaceus]|uniref:Purine-binding chemotaxis protein CheW n=1 Tax=Geobacter argillaceus TaxID=345631 RepID=A0A562W8D4_9BACT|nr:purine-binding chemotaxis protein CheW [Geobacter argillaceus]
MNLAEIRKKALQEKDAGETSPGGSSVVSAPTYSLPVREDPTGPAAPGISDELAVPGVEELPEQQPIPVAEVVAVSAPAMQETVPVPEPLSFPGTMATASFDPIAELLAGRELAGGEDEDELSALIEGAASLDRIEEYLCFRVANENYAINIMEIKEIIKPREVTEVPRVPSYVLGVISLRGVIIPIYDMRRRLGLDDVPGGNRRRILVVRHREEFAGILVDQVSHVVKLGAADEEQPPAVLDGTGREFVQGIGHHDGSMLILLDLDKILDMSLS